MGGEESQSVCTPSSASKRKRKLGADSDEDEDDEDDSDEQPDDDDDEEEEEIKKVKKVETYDEVRPGRSLSRSIRQTDIFVNHSPTSVVFRPVRMTLIKPPVLRSWRSR